MAKVCTVLGPIAPEDLGITAIHEHIVYGMPGWEYAPEVKLDRSAAFEKVAKDLLEFKALGGRTIVDCSGAANGRDVDFYQALSRTTGMNIVASTGFGAEPGIPGHFVSTSYSAKAADYVADMFLQELEHGMIAGFMKRATVTAAVINVANQENQITQTEEKFYRAAARAAKRTGCAVMTHGARMALQQIGIMTEEGLDPARIVVGQCDLFPDRKRDLEVVRKGAYVAYDHIAQCRSMDDEKQAIDSIKALLDAGQEDKVLLSCCAISYPLGCPQTKQSFGYLVGKFSQELRRAGIQSKTVKTLLVENPRRVLAY